MAWILALPKGRSAGSSEALLVPESVSTLGPSVRAGLNARLCYQVEAIVASCVHCYYSFQYDSDAHVMYASVFVDHVQVIPALADGARGST